MCGCVGVRVSVFDFMIDACNHIDIEYDRGRIYKVCYIYVGT